MKVSYYFATEKFGEIEKVGTATITTITYDTIGNEIEEKKEGWDPITGSFGHHIIYEYDTFGNQKIKYFSSIDGKFENDRRYISKFDSNGKKIEMKEYDANGHLNGKEIYKYDTNRNLIEMNEYYSAESLPVSKTIYKYNTHGDKIEEVYYSRGVLDGRRVFEFDKNGNMIKIDEYSHDGSLRLKETLKYDYFDKIGKWHRRISFEFDKPFSIEERDIKYY